MVAVPHARDRGAVAARAAATEAQNAGQATGALVCGAGPAGLATALVLASHGIKTVVAERSSDISHSDPDRSYMYAIDGRGRRLLDRFGLSDKLAEQGVDSKVVEVNQVLPSGRVKRSRQAIKDESKILHWIPRNKFIRLLEEAAEHGPHAPHISLLRSTEVAALERSGGGGSSSSGSSDSGGSSSGLRVTLRNTQLGSSNAYEPQLLVGADGQDSVVRQSMAAWAAEDTAARSRAAGSGSGSEASSAGHAPHSFGMRAFPSLATGLRFKVLQLPPNPVMRDGTALANPTVCLLISKPTAGMPAMRLGLLPVKDEAAPRTANLITLPDHPIWQVSSGEEMYAVFAEAFPQADWRALVPQPVMERFAASRGGQFPAPQHSQGMALVLGGGGGEAAAGAPPAAGPESPLALQGCGAVLLGDAAHCFPPDLGQGVNSALEDALVLQRHLAAAGGSLPLGLASFDAERLPDSAALAKLVQVGYPLQYNQYPKIRLLWNLGFLAQLLLNKVAPWLVSPPLFLRVQDPQLRYSEVLAETQRSRRVLAVLLAVVMAGLAWLAARAAGLA